MAQKISCLFIIFFIIIYGACNFQNKNDKKIQRLLKHSDKLYQENKYKNAIKCFNEIINNDTTIAIAYYRRGYCRAQLSEYKKSNEDFKKSITLKFRIDDSYVNLGCNYAILMKDSLALDCFRTAFRLLKKRKFHF